MPPKKAKPTKRPAKGKPEGPSFGKTMLATTVVVLALLLLAGAAFLFLRGHGLETLKLRYAQIRERVLPVAPAPAETLPAPSPAESPSSPPPEESRPYEAERPGDLEEMVKMADLALLKSLREEGVDRDSLELTDVQYMQRGQYDFHFQSIRVGLRNGRDPFLERLRHNLAERVPTARLDEESPGVTLLSIGEVATHRLYLDSPSRPVQVPRPQPRPGGPGRLAIVIDDIGEDMAMARGLAALDIPVTFSIWPFSSAHAAASALARQRGLEVFVHMPMQPDHYPRINPGPGAILTFMPPEEIRERVELALRELPEARGMNNHMGSAFTESYDSMVAALEPLRGRGLLFLDSVTSAKSAARRAASAAGVPFAKRDVFLDNQRNVGAILYQLRKAQFLAKTYGRAIAIGHPHPETLAALRRFAQERDPLVEITTVEALGPQ